jgi:hypothetical protein
MEGSASSWQHLRRVDSDALASTSESIRFLRCRSVRGWPLSDMVDGLSLATVPPAPPAPPPFEATLLLLLARLSVPRG